MSYPTAHHPPCHVPRQPVLVLIHPDHFVEVYGPNHVDVMCRDVPRVSTPAGEILALEYVELTVPRRYRDLSRRAMHMPRIVTPASIAATQDDVELLRAIQSITPSEPLATWTL